MVKFVERWVALFKRRAWRTKDAATQLRRAAGDNDLRKCLGPFDLIMLGIGETITYCFQKTSSGCIHLHWPEALLPDSELCTMEGDLDVSAPALFADQCCTRVAQGASSAQVSLSSPASQPTSMPGGCWRRNHAHMDLQHACTIEAPRADTTMQSWQQPCHVLHLHSHLHPQSGNCSNMRWPPPVVIPYSVAASAVISMLAISAYW